MNEKFFQQKIEKQDLMINGALAAFARHGYRQASTDEMVKECGVSKGLWFHYFENKQGLYSFVVNYALRYAALELEGAVRQGERDFFEIREGIERAKVAMTEKYASLPLLLANIKLENAPEAKEMIAAGLAQYEEKKLGLLGAMDRTKFRIGTNERTLQLVIDATFDEKIREIYLGGSMQVGEYMEFVSSTLMDLKMMAYANK
ncbi:MAG: TetR/AcrR family transcriptional regulator [Lachnospiraceae bacterium]|nr:TetR/AcrR family transcriptional regulator [Lachnospiraceae bacterium]